MSKIIEITVPDIGDFNNVPVIEVLVKPGDRIEKDTSLVTLESDKSTMEIPSSHAGTVKSIKLKVGDKVTMGSEILTLEAGGGCFCAGSGRNVCAGASSGQRGGCGRWSANPCGCGRAGRGARRLHCSFSRR